MTTRQIEVETSEGHVVCHDKIGSYKMCYTEYISSELVSSIKLPVICVHGLTRNQTDFQTIAIRLAQEGHRVVCVDIVGRGKSDYAPDASSYNIVQYASDIGILVNHLQWEKFHWIGTSMGGLISLAYGSQPEHAHQIAGLILNDIGPYVESDALKHISSYISSNKVFMSRSDAQLFLKTTYSGVAPMDDSDWETFVTNSIEYIQDAPANRPVVDNPPVLWTQDGLIEDPEQVKQATVRLAYDPRIAGNFGATTSGKEEIPPIDLWYLFNRLNIDSLLILRGANSPVLSQETATKMLDLENNSAAIKNDRILVTIQSCGHTPSLRHAFQVNTMAGFLEQVENSRCD